MRKADKTRHTGKKKYGKRIIAAVLILAAAAVTGFFVYRHFHKQEEMPADASPVPEQVIRTDLENIITRIRRASAIPHIRSRKCLSR